MARLISGANGAFSGKVGSVIGATWKGIGYIRGQPKVNKKRKRTGAEKANNNRFGYCTRLLTPLKAFLEVGLCNYPGALTWLNAACRLNLPNVVVSEEGLGFDFPSLQLSYGDLPGLPDLHMEVDAGQLKISWSRESSGYWDQVVLVIYHQQARFLNGAFGGARRAEGSLTFSLSNRHPAPAHVYLFLTTTNRSRVSATQYLGEI